jgi:hypothetical protein
MPQRAAVCSIILCIYPVQKELSKITDRDDEIKRVEDLRRLLLTIENPLSGHYVFTEEGLTDMEDSMIDNGFGYGSKETAAKAGILPSGGYASEGWRRTRNQPGNRGTPY